jgi:hypothetical protein
MKRVHKSDRRSLWGASPVTATSKVLLSHFLSIVDIPDPKAPRLFSFGLFLFQPFATRQYTHVALFFGPEKLEFLAVLILRIKISECVANAE